MQIFLGQGNPGREYAGNRHNVGFMAVEAIAAAHGFGPWRAKFQSQAAEGRLETPRGSVKALLLKPQTFYNDTGRAAGEAARFYKVDPGALVVLHDEIDLAPGKFRTKRGGGTAGNNGVRSIAGVLGPDFIRCRIGVGRPAEKARVKGYVLHDFAKADAEWLDPLLDAIARSAPLLAAGDLDAFQTRVTHLAPAPAPAESDGGAPKRS